MKIDADPQANIRQSSGNPAEEEENPRSIGAREVKDITRKLTESTNLVSQRLTETGVTTREPAWD